MWKRVENGEPIRPALVDNTSSQKYIYVRKNIVFVDAIDEEHPAHYKWDELKVLKENWETFQRVMEHDSALDDVYSALAELAEIITEA